MGEYKKAVETHGSIRKAADAMGIPPTTFADRLNREGKGKVVTRAESKPGASSLSAEQLLLRHSAEHQIRHAAEQLERDVFEPEPEFVRRVGITGGYKHIVEREEFSVYRGRASGGIVYWSHPESIAEMKEGHVLR